MWDIVREIGMQVIKNENSSIQTKSFLRTIPFFTVKIMFSTVPSMVRSRQSAYFRQLVFLQTWINHLWSWKC